MQTLINNKKLVLEMNPDKTWVHRSHDITAAHDPPFTDSYFQGIANESQRNNHAKNYGGAEIALKTLKRTFSDPTIVIFHYLYLWRQVPMT